MTEPVSDCSSFKHAQSNISEFFKENIHASTQVSGQQKMASNNNSSYKMHADEDSVQRKESSKSLPCFRRRYLLMIVIALVVCIIVLMTLLINYSTRILQTNNVAENKPLLGKQSGEKENNNEGCEVEEGRKTFPDLDYALFGYNILRGYPIAVGHDPGLTHPIFAHNYQEGRHTADCRYHVPKGYILAPDVSCVTSFSSKVIKDSSQFVKSLSVTAEASAGGWGASFSASAEYKDKTSLMSSSENVFIFSQAKCNYYFAMIDEINPPQLHPSFTQMIKSLNTEKDCHRFFNYFGTHFLRYALFGAKFVYENKMSKKDYQQESQQSVSVSLKASYAGVFSLNGGLGLTSDQQKMAKQFKEKVETSTITIGAPPPEDGKTLTWASTVKDNPVPVEYKLESILNLFTEKYMKNTGIDYKSVLEKLQHAKNSYCSTLLNEGEVNSCRQSLTGYVIFNTLFFGNGAFSVFKSSFDLCTQRCSENPDCQAASFSQVTYKCFLYRATNTSILNVQESDKVKTVLFKDSLKLLEKTLYLHNVRFPTEVSRETSTSVGNSTACYEQCQMDSVCFAYTFRPGDLKTNCLLFQDKDIIADSLKFEKDALTAIRVKDQDILF